MSITNQANALTAGKMKEKEDLAKGPNRYLLLREAIKEKIDISSSRSSSCPIGQIKANTTFPEPRVGEREGQNEHLSNFWNSRGGRCARMEAVKRAFPEINFFDFMFMPNLKRITPEIAENIAACVIDVFTQYAEWYKVAKCVSEVSFKLQVELENAKQMEAQSENVISGLKKELEKKKRARVDDVVKAAQYLKKVGDSRDHLRAELRVSSNKNRLLSERIKLLEAQLKAEVKEKEAALVEGQEAYNRAVVAEVQWNEALQRVAEIKQKALDLQKRAKEAEKAIVEGPGAVKQKMIAEMDKFILRYNANVIRFLDLSWYEERHAQALVEAWYQVIKDEASDPEGKELDEAALEKALPRDDEIEILYNWRSLYPKTSTVAVEASGLSLAHNIETSTSTHAAATPAVPGYNLDEPHIHVITFEGGQPALGPLPLASQDVTLTATESTVISTSTTAPVVQATETPGPGDEMIEALKVDPNDDILLITGVGETSEDLTLKEIEERLLEAQRVKKE